MPDAAPPTPQHPQKSRTGLTRMRYALGYSLQGLRAGWGETAFRQEASAAVLLLPWAWVLGQHWLETALLVGALVGVLVAELLNSGIEAAIDRFGPELHPLAKRAKDMGSAAVLLSLLWCIGLWATALWKYLNP